jgi:hypothetical protein
MTGGFVVKELVFISEEPCEVPVYRKSRAVWIAVGDFKGRFYEGQGPSPSAAAYSWARQAENVYRNN